jgi:hypothetical protein
VNASWRRRTPRHAWSSIATRIRAKIEAAGTKQLDKWLVQFATADKLSDIHFAASL